MKNERKTAEFGTGEDAERLHDFLREREGRSVPHVAPCSCELHARIRELEASLRVAEDNEKERAGQVVDLDEKVRELEAELAISKADALHYHRWSDEQFARAEKAEARVVELEKNGRRIRWHATG